MHLHTPPTVQDMARIYGRVQLGEARVLGTGIPYIEPMPYVRYRYILRGDCLTWLADKHRSSGLSRGTFVLLDSSIFKSYIVVLLSACSDI